jgi:hypothetical protein
MPSVNRVKQGEPIYEFKGKGNLLEQSSGTAAQGENMKTRSLIVTLALLICPVLGWSANEASGFAALKGLAGQWEGTMEGQKQTITWKLISAGSVMMEEMEHESMVSMYHVDNDRLLMTHYCSAQNQPRMQAEVSADGKTIAFKFIDGTNMAKPHDAHMKSMTLTIRDQNHISEQWTFLQDGKERTEVFQLTRKQ